MLRRSTVIWVLLAFAAFSAVAESQNMYKWTDDQGEVHYSQFPPPGHKAEKMKAPPPAPGPSTNAGGNDLQEPGDATKKQDEKQAQEENDAKRKAALEEMRKKNCEIARQNLVNLQRGGNVRYKGPNGEVIRLTEEDRQKRIEDANTHIKENCSP
jgi:hypothetical protein